MINPIHKGPQRVWGLGVRDYGSRTSQELRY